MFIDIHLSIIVLLLRACPALILGLLVLVLAAAWCGCAEA
jgi:hypothetical protein